MEKRELILAGDKMWREFRTDGHLILAAKYAKYRMDGQSFQLVDEAEIAHCAFLKLAERLKKSPEEYVKPLIGQTPEVVTKVLRTVLYKIIRNLVCDGKRKSRRRPPSLSSQECPDGEADPFQLVAKVTGTPWMPAGEAGTLEVEELYEHVRHWRSLLLPKLQLLLDVLMEALPDPLTPGELRKRLCERLGKDISDDTVRDWRRKLAEAAKKGGLRP